MGRRPARRTKGKATALPPHQLDKVFWGGNTAHDLTNGLLNNDLFKTSVQAAEKAKREWIAARAAPPPSRRPNHETSRC